MMMQDAPVLPEVAFEVTTFQESGPSPDCRRRSAQELGA
jgi:hypothetical protein